MILALALAALPLQRSADPMTPAARYGSGEAGVDLVGDVGIDQRLGESLPLDVIVRDEAGAEVPLGTFFGEKPVVLALVYYECPMLCQLSMEGLVDSLRPLAFDVGEEFEVCLLSIDPDEGPELAERKKRSVLSAYGREGTDAGWHFLTAEQETVRRVTEAVGFRYSYDPALDQYAHAAGIQLVTPTGELSRYFYGVEFPTRDLRLGLVEASEGRIGTLTDAVLLWCYHYDPTSGTYGLAILTTIRVLGTLTVLAIGAFVVRHLRRDRAAVRSALNEG